MLTKSPAGGGNGSMTGGAQEPPPGIDYDMWVGPSAWFPYNETVVNTTAWLFISDFGLGCIDGAWGIHDVDIAQCNEVRRECDKYAMPLIIWAYPRVAAIKAKGGIDSLYAVDYAARVACERDRCERIPNPQALPPHSRRPRG